MKKILALLLAVIMVMSLAACGGDTPKTTDPTNNTTKGGEEQPTNGNTEVTDVTLKVWGPAEDQAEGNSWLKSVEDAFEAAHPEYNITWVNEVCNEGEAGTMVSTDPAAAADVYMFANDQLGTLVTAGAISRLGGAFEEQVKNDNGALQVSTVTHTDGNIYGFPVTNNTWFMYYNKDVFTEEDVKDLDVMLEKGVVAFPWGTGWYSGTFFFANGGECFGPNGTDAAAGIQFGGDHGGYEAAETMYKLAANPNFKDDASGLGNAGMKDGTVHAYFSGSWDYGGEKGLKAAMGDKVGAVQLPVVTIGGEKKQMMSFAGTKAVGVNPHSANPAAATQFAAFMASVESQKSRYEMRGVIPAATILAEDEDIKSNMIAVAEINTMTNTAVVQSAIPEMNNFWAPIGNFGGLCASGAINADNYKEQVEQMMEALNQTGL